MNTVPLHDPQNNPETTFIYALIDPETNQVRYVGKANNLEKRLKRHLWASNTDCYRHRWILSLAKRGLIPSIQVLEEVPVDIWPEREIYWISFYREQQGTLLTNTSLGGKGGNHSPEMRAKLSASLKGRKLKPESVAKRSATVRGRKRSEATRAKIADTKRGRKRTITEEWRRNIGNASRGHKNPPETIARMSLARKKWHAMKNASPPGSPTLWDNLYDE